MKITSSIKKTKMLIKNAKVFIDGNFLNVDVKFDNKKILEIGNNLEDEEVIDAKGNYLYAGLIDCHNHGGWLRNFMDTETGVFGTFEDEIKFLCDKFPSAGVTTVYPTLSGSNYEIIARSVKKIRKVKSECKGAKIAKFQFEGLYMSLDRYLTDARVPLSIEHSNYIVDNDYSDIGLFHVSCDAENTIEWVDYMVSKGVMPCVGNTQASAEDVHRAADHGLCQADHMYNGYEAMHHRKEGAAVAVLLDDRIKAQITCDSHHVSPSFIKLLIKTKGIDNVYGVTDQSHYSGLSEGKHTLPDGKTVIAKDGLIYDTNGYINSGNLALNDMMKAARDKCHLSMNEVGLLYAENVAKCLNIKDRGKIEVGRIPDFVIMDEDYKVLQTIIDGEVYYVA